MHKTRIDNQSEWVALVSSWVDGIDHEDDNLRTTGTLDELIDALGVDRMTLLGFEIDRGLSPGTLGYNTMLAEAAAVAPKSFPCVVIWRFITISDHDDCRPTFLEAHINVVSQEDLQ